MQGRTPASLVTGRVDRPARAMVYVIVATALMTVQDAIIKVLLETYPLMEVLLIRSLVMLPVIVALAAIGGQLRTFRTRRIGAHLLRVILNLLAFVTFFSALHLMPLADTLAIAFSAPIFIVLFSVVLLREKVGPWRWLAVAIGFVGVLVMIRPGVTAIEWPALLALLASVFYALWMLTTRHMADSESSLAMLFYSALAFVLAGAVTAPLAWVPPLASDLPMLLGVAVITTAGLLFLTMAYRTAPASLLAPFDYTAMVWAVALGYAIWGDVPGPWMWVGTALVVAAGLIIVHREARLRKPVGSIRGPVEE